MKAIKWALTERWYGWEDAWQLAQNDPQINLDASDGENPIFLPEEQEVRLTESSSS